MFGKSKGFNAEEFIEGLRSSDMTYNSKVSLLGWLFQQVMNKKKIKLDASQKRKIAEFALTEARDAIVYVQSSASYEEADDALSYIEVLNCVLSNWHNDPETWKPICQVLADMYREYRFLELKTDAFFASGNLLEHKARELIDTVKSIAEEYHRGVFLIGLEESGESCDSIPLNVRNIFADHIRQEIERYTAMPELNDTVKLNLEYAAGAAGVFMTDQLATALRGLAKLNIGAVNYYILMSLVDNGWEIEDAFISTLAEDICYANNSYQFLREKGMAQRFPLQYTDPVYLAKSDMVHWLMYPTELGKEPDRIEYVGRIKASKDDYHIFKFMSNSDTLSEDIKNKWLLGWSSENGRTFSHFDEYAKFDQGSTDKTLKYIKKKVL